MPLQPGSIDTPKPVCAFHSTLPAAVAVLSNHVTSPAQMRASGELEAVANKASDTFALPRPLTLRLTTCGSPDAWYNTQSGELTLCYERLEHFRQLAAQLPKVRPAQTP